MKTKKACAEWLASTDYAVSIGVSDEGYVARQYARMYSLADLQGMVARRQAKIADGSYPVKVA